MKIEDLVSKMMSMTVVGRLWHWTTDNAQHHVTYENFLTQNDTFVDSVVESALGNDIKINFSSTVGVKNAVLEDYSIESAKSAIKDYRGAVIEFQSGLETNDQHGSAEISTILDDVVELTSKTLYMLRLK